MLDDRSRISTELLIRIHDQLGPQAARELTFHASDDQQMFCASVLAKVASGQLDLSPEQVALLGTGLRRSAG